MTGTMAMHSPTMHFPSCVSVWRMRVTVRPASSASSGRMRGRQRLL